MFLRLLPCVLVLAACDPTLDVPDDAVACADVRCTAGTCGSNGGQPQCRCGPWEQAAGLTCAVGAFDRPDDHGGSPGEATVLALPMSARQARLDEGAREGMRDRDLFAFTAEAGHAYAFRCEQLSLPDCQLRLLDASGHVASHVFQQEPRGWSLLATLAAGTWYVEVSSEEGVGTYTYQLHDLGRDDHADDLPGATVLQVPPGPQPFPVIHSALHDRDVFTFRSRPGHGYRFTCEQQDSTRPDPRDMELALIDARGATVDSDSGSGAWSSAVRVLATQAADWWVTVRVVSSPWRTASSCRFEDVGPDDHPDVRAGATPLHAGVPVPVTLHSNQDVDVLSFTGRAGHVYTVRDPERGRLGIRVTDASGQVLRGDTTHSLGFKTEVDGTYFVQVLQGPVGVYTFLAVLEDQGPDDHGDTPDTATPLGANMLATGRFETPQDTDAIRFFSEANAIYQVSCEPACDMLFQHDGALNSMTLGPGRVLIDASEAAPVTLLLRPRPDADGFRLSLGRVATDDHGDNILNASPLTLPASVSGRVQTSVDADAFTVWLQAGHTYRLEGNLGVLRLSLLGPTRQDVTPRDGLFVADMTGVHLLRVFGALALAEPAWSFTLHEE
jgi:hypothetical protein